MRLAPAISPYILVGKWRFLASASVRILSEMAHRAATFIDSSDWTIDPRRHKCCLIPPSLSPPQRQRVNHSRSVLAVSQCVFACMVRWMACVKGCDSLFGSTPNRHCCPCKFNLEFALVLDLASAELLVLSPFAPYLAIGKSPSMQHFSLFRVAQKLWH